MIMIEKLYSDDTADMIRVLEFIKNSHEISVGAIQRDCDMGYGRVARYIDLMIDAGILKPRKYRMVVGEDGKRHRQYLPYELAASDAELGDCIARLRRRMCGENG